jgi:hypothetical protein
MDNMKLVDSFADTILSSKDDFKEISGDIIEYGIDSEIDGAIECIPIVKTILAITKMGLNVREKHLLKKTFEFWSQFMKREISQEKIDDYKKKYKDTKQTKKELERVLLLIDREIEITKVRIMANLFNACINGDMHYSEFQTLTEILNQMYLFDITNFMLEIENVNGVNCKDRIITLGLAIEKDKLLTLGDIGRNNRKKETVLTRYGQLMKKYGFYNIDD